MEDGRSAQSNDIEAREERLPLEDQGNTFLSGKKLIALLFSLSLANFFAGYDATCVATIAPIITTEFRSLNDVSWYGIAYSLATCATILPYGKFYKFFPDKVVFSVATLVFVGGSALCAAAQWSPMFILGRAIAGLGNGGILTGSNIILLRATPLARRPIYLGIVGGVECFALAVAPLLAGVITEYSSWRVCFYISIPCGVVAVATIIFVVPSTDPPQQSQLSWKSKLLQLDLPGATLFVAWCVCLILALEWGGTQYAWSDARVIALLSLFGTFAVAFMVQQVFAKSTATIPPALFKSWTMTLAVTYIFSTSAALYVFTYYTPIFYQVVMGTSTFGSGLRDLSRLVALVISLLLAGTVTAKIGYYNPVMMFGGALMTIGAGLTTTFHPGTTLAEIIVYQALFGLGCGAAFQQPYVAVQRVLSEDLVPSAVTLLTFMQFLGNIVSLAVAQNLFVNKLAAGLHMLGAQLDVTTLLNSGLLSLRSSVPKEDEHALLVVCSDALRAAFYLGLGVSCATLPGAIFMKWRSIKSKEEGSKADEKTESSLEPIRHEKEAGPGH